ncbi:polyketide synthase [Actinoplanes sp. N902-109]|uniref:beta-ketoacyl synthase N-terminal-like domain-containing protein n=1 Tax=Actinoplanes sp. (strain N902-109) TaxID=649831 RepID=UPI000329650B|nr:polyketide synthase [Actinoplanes sp. N902-109]AGL13750.1 6-deoxyerythronolide-B synthase [Actinoplanes sp. N902-109]
MSTTALNRALATIQKLRAELAARSDRQPIAVVGVGLRFPGGLRDLDGYWSALSTGQDLVRPLPEGRREPFAAQWATLPHRGGFLDDVLGFDAAFFGIRTHEAQAMDPQHRILLEVSWEALEDAGITPRLVEGQRAGFFAGITNTDYNTDWRPADPEFSWLLGNLPAFAAGRVAHTLGLTGPAMTVDTACSSSLVAVHLARQALSRRECDVALAGGANLVVSPGMTRIMAQSGLLAPDGTCKPFDARANGFTRSEGCGIVVLKRLDDALRDDDRIYALIQGSALNHDGRSTSISAPSVSAQTDLIKAALADADLGPEAVGLVEAHGTGTALGDPIEMEAVAEALGRPAPDNVLHVGSVKANLGHQEAAAGIAGLLKAILCLHHRAVPPLLHFRTLNPRIDLSGTGIRLTEKLQPWLLERSGEHAAVSSFGLSGTNAHIILGAPPERTAVDGTVAVAGFEMSARDPAALRALVRDYHGRLRDLADGDYAAFAYTATQGRARHPQRLVVVAANRHEAIAALRRFLDAPAVSSEADLGEDHALPRRVLSLPPYPWQHRHLALQPPGIEDLTGR